MLYSVVVEIESVSGGLLRPTHGHYAHAILLNILGEVDPVAAKALHDRPGAKPFTVSPLEGRFEASEAGLALKAGERFRLRFTLLDPSVFEAFIAWVLQAPSNQRIRLGSVDARIVAVHTQPGGHHWASFSEFEGLLEEAEASRQVSLAFASPTAFHFGGGQAVVFPEPRLVFGSLLTRWNAFSATKLERSLAQRFAEDILVCQYSLSTRMLDFGRYRKLGFVGRCDYEVNGRVPLAELKQINALADFAFYSGVGYKTTMGMGQARRVRTEETGDRWEEQGTCSTTETRSASGLRVHPSVEGWTSERTRRGNGRFR